MTETLASGYNITAMRGEKQESGWVMSGMPSNIFSALLVDFEERGIAAIEDLREQNPTHYLWVAAKLLPERVVKQLIAAVPDDLPSEAREKLVAALEDEMSRRH